jgi:hypothetical protein
MQHNAEQCAVKSYRIIIMYDGDFLTVHTYPVPCKLHYMYITILHTEYIRTGFPVYIATSSSSWRRHP